MKTQKLLEVYISNGHAIRIYKQKKARYTVTEVANGWAGAVIKKANLSIWAGAVMHKSPKNAKKANRDQLTV